MLRVADYLVPSRDVMVRDKSLNETTRETRNTAKSSKRTTTTKRDQELKATRSDHEGHRYIFKPVVMRGRRGTSSDRDRSDDCGRA
jgi:hypothetical protein